ncbi:MAG: DUF4276 family protein [Lewinellaceae bacterium]|nr:DUF4276 family protein [Saprospiraceae bacterium]MCB9337702.1 DUF4276 family protein [Lewinellaceae bacterium]
MKRLIIIVEGETEEAFVKDVLGPYLLRFQIFDVRPIRIKTSAGQKGGFVNYVHLKNDVHRILKSEKEVVVSTFVDFFRLPKKYFPKSEECFEMIGSDAIIDCLEEAMAGQINDERFLPYIQKHEFEALLFASNKGFEKYFDKTSCEEANEIITKFDNPEDINSTANGAPSKRLVAIDPTFEKDSDGIIMALEIGIETILQKCPRFAAWAQQLIDKTQADQ